MRILISCEFSGVVREAFRAEGHRAYSCDLLPSEDGSPFHMQGDVLNILNAHKGIGNRWDLMIAHPPCTYLCNSGVRWLAPGGKIDGPRYRLMIEACAFFAALYHAPTERVCIENPVMHKYARGYLKVAFNVPTYSQTIQPYEHGHGETKRTGLWLRGLPPLKPTEIVSGRTPRVHFASPGPDRWKERSRTLPGIAKAMAEQWPDLE